jgi:hypothetical protein
MSLFHTATIACPKCGAAAEYSISNSIAAARRPDLREAIVDGSFQRQTCAACAATFRINPVITYMDTGRHSWILVRPGVDRPLWDSFEAGALDIFNDSFGLEAPAAARAFGEQLRVRVTFGWSGLREKLLCEDYGIRDVTLELTKLALIGTSEAANLSESASLRLIDRTEDGTLLLAWLSDETEKGDEVIEVPRAVLDRIDADAAWDAARQELSGGPFVDVTKLLIEPELAVPD